MISLFEMSGVNQDSVPQTTSGHSVSNNVRNSAFLFRTDWKFMFRIFNLGNFLFVVVDCVFGEGLAGWEFMLDATESECKASKLFSDTKELNDLLLWLE